MRNGIHTKVDRHNEIMGGDLTKMSEIELGRAVETLINRYIPNMVTMMAHPYDIIRYRQRLVAAMAELAVRQNEACAKYASHSCFR